MQRSIIHWRDTPPSPGQLAAWQALWQRLLGVSAPQTPQRQDAASPGTGESTVGMREMGRHVKASGAALPEASQDFEAGFCGRHAVSKTASTSLVGTKRH